MDGKRVDELDVVRAMAIFFVVLGHVLCYDLQLAPFALELIYSFHMPVMFMLSGYVAEMGWKGMAGGDATSRRVYGKVGRSARRLLLPYVLCGALIAPLAAALVSGEWAPTFLRFWDEYFLSNHGLWYLPACFILVCSHVVSDVLAAKRRWWVRLGIGFSLAVPVFLLYRFTHCDFLRSALSYWFSFHVGAMLARWPQLVIRPRLSICGGLFVVWLVLAFVFAEQPHSLMGNLIKPFTGIAAFFPLAYVAHRLKAVRGLATVGQSTLVIYCAEAVLGAWFFRFFAPSSLAWAALWSLVFVLAVHGVRMAVLSLREGGWLGGELREQEERLSRRAAESQSEMSNRG